MVTPLGAAQYGPSRHATHGSKVPRASGTISQRDLLLGLNGSSQYATGSTDDVGRGDHYQFTATEGDVVSILLCHLPTDLAHRLDTSLLPLAGEAVLDPFLCLIDPNGQEIAFNDDELDSLFSRGSRGDATLQNVLLQQAGTYTIIATSFQGQGNETGSYALALSGPATLGPLSMRMDEGSTCPGFYSFLQGIGQWSMMGSTDNLDSADHYEFYGYVGGQVSIYVCRYSSSLDPFVCLLDPGGTRLAFDDDSGGDCHVSGPYSAAEILWFTLPVEGTYRIVVSSFAGATTGDYEVELYGGQSSLSFVWDEGPICGPLVPQPPPGPYDQYAFGSIDSLGSGDHYEFFASETDHVTIELCSPNGSLDPEFCLLNPSGSSVTSANGNSPNCAGGALIQNFTLWAGTGNYRVIAMPYGGSGMGDYYLTLSGSSGLGNLSLVWDEGPTCASSLPPAPPIIVEPAEPPAMGDSPGSPSPPFSQVSGVVGVNQGDAYSFFCKAGQVITIELCRRSSSLDPYVILTDDDGVEIASNNNSNDDCFVPGPGSASVIRDIVLPYSGSYTIFATSWGGTFGSYVLTISGRDAPLTLVESDIPCS
jgi:hypothetical protein